MIARALCTSATIVMLPALPARADAELALTWLAPPQCPSATWASERIQVHLGRALGTGSTSQLGALRARVEIGLSDGVFRLRVTTVRAGTRGERVLEHARCDELTEAASLMVALAVADGKPLEQPNTAPVATSTPQTAPPQAALDSERPPGLLPKGPLKRDPALPRQSYHVRAGALLDAGFLPSLSIGPELRIGVRNGLLDGELGAFWLPTRESQRIQGVAVSALALTGHGCLQRGWQRIVVAVCLDAEMGQAGAVGRGLSRNLRKRALFISAGATLRLRVRTLFNFWLVAEPGLALPLLRQRFVSTDTDGSSANVLHMSRPVALRTSLGVELSF